MKNDYKINGDVAEIYINSIHGDNGVLTVLIDTEDFERVNQYKTSWVLIYKGGRFDSIVTKPQINKKRFCIRLHRLIMNCPNNLVVDHINGDILDNRKCNLRIITQAENSTNLSPINKYCKTKYRNIYLEGEKYAVRINNRRFGRYDDINEVIKVRDNEIKNIFPLRRK